ncbi:Nucleotidyl transferase [Mycolicibacterium smegmatis MC2 155]|uniref:Nucleotidyl transferase n=2 Tax=Mycobacteriaceae TaxID=1762 RepID=I7G505_MYCS2|nr:Nucleotidyl transferase [Mycolicibacterium smegmatis MC2 155]
METLGASGRTKGRGDDRTCRSRCRHPGRRAGHTLRPLTLSAPKPMLPTAGLPFLTHLLSRIAAAGIKHVVMGTSYKAEVFEAEFGDGSKLGIEIDYVTETEALGTGGAIANVADKLRHDTVMVFNGDVLSCADLGAILATHDANDADVTLHLVRVGDPRAFGCVPTDADGRVTAFLEKTQDPPTDQINAGCYVFKREVIDRLPKGRVLSVEREVFPALLADGLRIYGHVDASYWRDMGTPEDFVRGSADLVRGIAGSPALNGQRGESLVHDGAGVAPGALLIGGTVVGRGAEIGAGARLDGAVIFDGVRVEAGAVIERSIIGFGARIGPRALIRDGVIGDGADIGARCELLRGARVWPGVTIPDGGIRYSTDV